MAKIREDLTGVVYIDGAPFAAGDQIPQGAVVAESLLAPEAKKPAPEPKRRRSTKED